MAVGFMCGYGPGLYATLLSASLATYLFATPTFGSGLSAQWTGAFFYMLVGGGIVAICVALRQALMRRDAVLEAFRQTEKRLARSEDSLRESAKSLEQQVEERTAALRSSEARLRTIFETSYQYQGLMTTDGILLEANAVSLQGIGSKIEDVAGRPFWETPWFSGTPWDAGGRAERHNSSCQRRNGAPRNFGQPSGGWMAFIRFYDAAYPR
jgi:PAS domain S-box-containing protein